ncbi:MAG: ribonuclease P protein component [Verrucomicrobia bacterium]|nr:MAG: ribonuclease P protein component [Verrucomicrobiota bacterium]
MRLPRQSSIRDRAIFALTKDTGRAKAGRFLILSTLENEELGGLRTGFITTKRCGKAHDRVLLRRRFRSLVQAHAPKFFSMNRYLITIARGNAAKASFAELENDWIQQARRLGLFSPPRSSP